MIITDVYVRNLYRLLRYDTLTRLCCDIRLIPDKSGNLSPGTESTILIGKKIPCNQELILHRSQKLSIISRSCCFNDFDHNQLDEWLKYVYKQLFYGVNFVCLQDFPTEYVELFANYGHIVHIVYGIGRNGKLISNAIIINPGVISKADFDSCQVWYLPEKSNMCDDFIPGSLILYFPSKQITIGSVYAGLATKVSHRRDEMRNRSKWIWSHETQTASQTILCGNFNPRTTSFLTDKAHMVKTDSIILNLLVYNIRLALFIFLSLCGNTSLKELKANSKFGLVFPKTSTMKIKNLFGFTIPFDKMPCVADLVQTSFNSEIVDVGVFSEDELSDHRPIRVLIHE
jgi:hypothetical protein